MKLTKKLRRLRRNVTIYYQTLGMRGLVASVANFAVGYPKYMAIAAGTPGVNHPLFVRLRTTDPETYQDVFVDREYEYEAAFSTSDHRGRGSKLRHDCRVLCQSLSCCHRRGC